MGKSREESGAGKWSPCYKDGAHRRDYGRKTSYRRSVAWLEGNGMIEDWGCGCRDFEKVLHNMVPPADRPEYIGVDGTAGFCDYLKDLEVYTSRVPCLNMRHVLEHNVNWRKILENALKSYTKRMTLVLFLRMAETDTNVRDDNWEGHIIPNIRLCEADLREMLKGHIHHEDTYRKETIFYLEKA